MVRHGPPLHSLAQARPMSGSAAVRRVSHAMDKAVSTRAAVPGAFGGPFTDIYSTPHGNKDKQAAVSGRYGAGAQMVFRGLPQGMTMHCVRTVYLFLGPIPYTREDRNLPRAPKNAPKHISSFLVIIFSGGILVCPSHVIPICAQSSAGLEMGSWKLPAAQELRTAYALCGPRKKPFPHSLFPACGHVGLRPSPQHPRSQKRGSETILNNAVLAQSVWGRGEEGGTSGGMSLCMVMFY